MVKHTERVAGRIPLELADDLQAFCEREGINNSEALRLLIKEGLEARRAGGSTETVFVALPQADLDIIDRLTDVGEAETRADAVRYAVKHWLNHRVEFYSQGVGEFERSIEEALDKRAERMRRKDELERTLKP